MFKEVSTNLDFIRQEEDILAFWKDHSIFDKSIEQKEGQTPFVFLEGPPFANAPPGVHHVLARIMKDSVCRYKTMTGHQVHRKAGWDTHGLPVEYQVEKQLNIENKQDLEAYGIKQFIEKCKENVFQFEQDWRRMTERIGFWVDLDDPYITLSNDYIESVWWVLKQAWQKNLLQKGHKVQPYCARCGTTLASHEVAQGYQTVTDPSIYVKFPLQDDPSTSFLVWTTTPWTLPSNVAIVVGADYDYATVEYKGQNLILAKDLVDRVFGEQKPKIQSICKGRDLVGLRYQPIFDFAGDLEQKGFYVIDGDFVNLTDGTGLVHTAPAFGQDDYDMLVKHNLPFVQLVDTAGKFVEAVSPWQGMFVKDADDDIIRNLADRGLMFKLDEYEHEYPFCWRCDRPLLYYARESWFIRTTAIRDRMLAHNQQINWYPNHIKDGRFGRWLENNVDWCLTRERYWGTPLPVWNCDSCDHSHVVGSIKELKDLAPSISSDLELHRPYIDEVSFSCTSEKDCPGTMYRVEDVIDCWFDSGVAHTAQWHYPFENKDKLAATYPADFISEAIDQTRGWFYSLLATGTLLYDQPAYKNVLCLELINAPDGAKMSKSRGNTVDPWSILNKQGADAMRWYFYTSCTPWTPRAFQEELIDEALRKFMGTLQNVYGFFVMYANLDQIDVSQHPPITERTVMDQWLLSKLNSTIHKVRSEMENYHLTNAPRAIADFVDELSNWYVRRSRDRFWGAEVGVDKQSAYVTLYEALVTVSKLLAPFTPFMADSIYRNLVGSLNKNAPESVHLTEFPTVDNTILDVDLEEKMDVVRRVIVMGRAARNQSGIKTRQPLSSIQIGGLNEQQKSAVGHLEELVFDELNIKSVDFVESLDQFSGYTAKANFKKLGPKYGKDVQQISQFLENENGLQIKNQLDQTGEVELVINSSSYLLKADEIELHSDIVTGYAIETEGAQFVALNVELDDELIAEGLARELVNKIQQQRKLANFNVSDRIRLSIQSTQIVQDAFDQYRSYVTSETLTAEVASGDTFSDKSFAKQYSINGESTEIRIEQITTG